MTTTRFHDALLATNARLGGEDTKIAEVAARFKSEYLRSILDLGFRLTARHLTSVVSKYAKKHCHASGFADASMYKDTASRDAIVNALAEKGELFEEDYAGFENGYHYADLPTAAQIVLSMHDAKALLAISKQFGFPNVEVFLQSLRHTLVFYKAQGLPTSPCGMKKPEMTDEEIKFWRKQTSHDMPELDAYDIYRVIWLFLVKATPLAPMVFSLYEEVLTEERFYARLAKSIMGL